jgi:lipid A 4'-phosphatase
MTYLKLTRSKILLACFVISSLALVMFPEIDFGVARLFFKGHFYLQQTWWEQGLHHGVGIFLVVSVSLVVAIYTFNKATRRSLGGVDGKKVCYLLLVLALGAGLIVNAGLKDHFGRARPRDTQEFGAAKQFTPAFVVSHECRKNCSFSSGDTAAAFFSLALVMAFGRKRSMFVASLVFGIAVSISRMASGAHFFSDTVVSFFIMFIVSDVLFHYMLAPKPVASANYATAVAATNGASRPEPTAA